MYHASDQTERVVTSLFLTHPPLARQTKKIKADSPFRKILRDINTALGLNKMPAILVKKLYEERLTTLGH